MKAKLEINAVKGIAIAPAMKNTTAELQHVPVGSTAVLYPYPSNLIPNPTLWQAVTKLRFRQPGTSLLVPGANGQIAFSPNLAFSRATATSTLLVGMMKGTIPAETPTLRAAVLAEFHHWNVQSFIALPVGTPNPTQAVAFFTWLFGQSPTVSAGATFGWYHLST